MYLNLEHLHIFHIAVELMLASAVLMLAQRLHSRRRSLTAIETELGLIKKRYEAATAGFHIRLLRVEAQSRMGTATAGTARSGRTGTVVQFNRGERELLMKVRRLAQ